MGWRGGGGRTVTAVDERRKVTADAVARYQTDYVVGRTCLFYDTRTTNCCVGAVLLNFGFPVISFRSWSYSIHYKACKSGQIIAVNVMDFVSWSLMKPKKKKIDLL